MKAAVAAEDDMANSFDDIISSSKSNVPVVGSNELFPEMVHEEGDDICQVGIDTDAPSYSNRLPEAVFESGAQDKRGLQAVEDRREHFLKRMATCVASKWKKSYAQTCGYIRARLSFAIIKQQPAYMPKGFQSKVEKWLGL
eukprot:Em0560g1a